MSVEVYRQTAQSIAASSQPSDQGKTRFDLWALAMIALGGTLTVGWIGGLIWLVLWVFGAI